MKIIRTEKAAEEAGKHISKLIEERKHAVLLMLSGGSAFTLLDHVDASALGPHVSITMLDERHSTDEAVNNFAQLSKTAFYARALDAGSVFISTATESGHDRDHEAAFLQYKVKQWRDENPDGTIIAVMGIGEDGHTAGMMPFPESAEEFSKLFEAEHIVAGYDASGRNPHPERITVTNRFLRDEVDAAIVLVSGERKRSALENVLKTAENKHEAPARIIHDMKNVFVYTDVDLKEGL